MKHQPYQSIKQWAVEDRPREKLATRGPKVLTDAELIAILIGSGNRTQSAVDLAKDILLQADNDFGKLGRYSIKDLVKFPGIGEAKAVSIAAALEIGRRRLTTKASDKVTIRSSRDIFESIKGYFFDLNHEEFWVFLLNRANQITHHRQLSIGGVAGTVVDVKLLFKYAIDHLASSIIIAHNHPSGQLRPSKLDEKITRKIQDGGKLMDIKVLDHLILSDNQYYSFTDNGLM